MAWGDCNTYCCQQDLKLMTKARSPDVYRVRTPTITTHKHINARCLAFNSVGKRDETVTYLRPYKMRVKMRWEFFPTTRNADGIDIERERCQVSPLTSILYFPYVVFLLRKNRRRQHRRLAQGCGITLRSLMVRSRTRTPHFEKLLR